MLKKILIGIIVLFILALVSLMLYLGSPFDPEQSDYFYMAPPENINRTIHNPDAGNTVFFARKAHETDGEYTLLQIDLEPGGGNTPHYHQEFSETFTAISGTLGLELQGEDVFLEEGESGKADIEEMHNFFNPTEDTIRFEVKIEPGNPGFEKFLYMLYGLANDNLTGEDGLPENPLHTAILVQYSDTYADIPGGWIISPMLKRLAGRAQRQGVESEMIERYYLNLGQAD